MIRAAQTFMILNVDTFPQIIASTLDINALLVLENGQMHVVLKKKEV